MAGRRWGVGAAILLALVLFRLDRHSVVLYAAATAIFAVGYGLTYAALSSVTVDIAQERALSVAGASQMFTLGYFVGLFGFPYIGGLVVHFGGVNALLAALAAIVAVAAGVAVALASPSSGRDRGGAAKTPT